MSRFFAALAAFALLLTVFGLAPARAATFAAPINISVTDGTATATVRGTYTLDTTARTLLVNGTVTLDIDSDGIVEQTLTFSSSSAVVQPARGSYQGRGTLTLSDGTVTETVDVSGAVSRTVLGAALSHLNALVNAVLTALG